VERLITVNGTGTVSGAPDRCQLDLRVGATSDSVRSATDAMAAAADVISRSPGGGSPGGVHRTADDPTGPRQRGQSPRLPLRDQRAWPKSTSAQDRRGRLGTDRGGGGRRRRPLSIDGIGFAHSDPTAQEHDALRRGSIGGSRSGRGGGRVCRSRRRSGDAHRTGAQVGPGPIRYRAVQMEMADVPVEPGAQTTTVEVKATYEIS
jgi:hypothetical protein